MIPHGGKLFPVRVEHFSKGTCAGKQTVVSLGENGRKSVKSKISTFRYIQSITKTCLYNFDPLNPTLYSKTGGLQGYTLFFLFLHKNIDRGYTLELPR